MILILMSRAWKSSLMLQELMIRDLWRLIRKDDSQTSEVTMAFNAA